MSQASHITLNFKDFCQRINQSEDDIYAELYEQHRSQFSVQNQKIAVKKLRKIFESTFSLANESGFQAMTLRKLAAHTQMSMGGLYAYIHSKDDIAQLIFSFLNSYCDSRIKDLLDETQTATQRLTTLIHIHVYFSELMHPWFYFAYMETKNLPKEYRHMAIQSELNMEHKIAEVIELGVNNSEFKCDNILLTASMIKALLQDWYLKRWKHTKREVNVDQYARQVEQISLCHLTHLNG